LVTAQAAAAKSSRPIAAESSAIRRTVVSLRWLEMSQMGITSPLERQP
jgi:hypothetical protein